MISKCKVLYLGIAIVGVVCWVVVFQKLGFAADSTRIIKAKIENDTLYPHNITEDSKDNSSNVQIDCINVNTASVEQLLTLHGIGPVLSERIAEYRKKNGNFKNASELIRVKGIGKVKLQKINNHICF